MADAAARESSTQTPVQKPQERRDLFEDDLTDERGPTPGQIEEASHTVVLDPDEPTPEGDDCARRSHLFL
jgi:hypothetical protein